MDKKECIALVLAGGQGSRLGILTSKLAKPAVPFGGKYRIIDFTLSNCANSDIDTVGVLTQYEPLVLNSYIGVGSHWGLDRKKGGVTVLPPFLRKSGGQWYMGTADAIYQNLDFIELNNPQYVLILSGDHIYKMDYSYMLEQHKDNNADLTIATMDVDLKEASRFGIIVPDKNNKIVEFQEKPEKPKSNLASMGVYIFTWEKLKEYLQEDAKNSHSTHDFGKDIIPTMLAKNEKLMVYQFSGYWKDVGTIESLWEANMDLLNERPSLDLNDKDWRIYSVNPVKPPHYLGKDSVVSNSLITEGCTIEGEVFRSVIFPGVEIKKGAKIIDSVIMSGTVVGENSTIEKSIVGEETVIEDNCKVGDSLGEITVVAENILLPNNTVTPIGVVIDKNFLEKLGEEI